MKKNSALGLVLAFSLILTLTAALHGDDFRSKPLSDRIVRAGDVEYVRGEILVKFRTDISDHTMAELYDEIGTEVMSIHRGGVRRLRVPIGADEQTMISRLRSDPRVEYAELNSVCHAHMTPDDPYYSYQWHFPKINMPQAWDISTGSGVIVGILDSGIAYENYPVPSYELDTVASGVTQYMVAPELNGTSFTGGYDFINNDSHPNDNDAHGTHVSGTVAQVTNNSTGTAGMAFDCTLMPVKVLDYSGSGTAQSLADGLYWAADNGAQVINMSLGWAPGYNPGSTVSNAVAYAYNHGVVLLASSGNAGASVVSYPAAYSQVIAVGATRYDDARPSYSQYGSALEICAPGGDLGVDQNGDGYGDGVLQMTFTGYNPGPPEQLADPTDFGYWFYDGTSMACPHAVGLVAMMIANGQTGVENIRTILHETAVDLGSAGWDQYYGYGRIDAYAALTYGGTPPVAQFTGSPTSGCDQLTVNFTDQSTGEITDWDWTFGDGGTSTAQNPSHQYTSPGDYTVSLTVTGPYGSDTETKTNYIHVDAAPVAGFYVAPTGGYAPLTVDFYDQATGQVTFWDWTFGDGGTSTAQNPTHQYTGEGDYTVTLTVTGPCGSDDYTRTSYIHVDPPSEWTVITYDDFEGGFGSYTDGGGDCALYTYGTYAHQGNNAADIQDNSGVASSFYHTASYNVAGYTELEVDFWFVAVSMDNSSEDFWVQYYDGSTWRTVATYARSIDFENNVFYHKVVTISSGEYNFPTNAKLRFMCDASGNADDVYIDEIEFRGKAGAPVPPVAAFAGDPTSGYAPLTVDFTDQSTGGPTGWSWTFGDGGTSYLQNPSHEYTEAGSYTVSLTVSNAVGSDDEVKTDYITVTIEPPVAAFVGDPTSGVVPLTVDFTDQSTGPIDTWAWDFGDGVGSSSAQNPSYEYTEIGTYTVTLTVTGPGGVDAEIKSDYISVTGEGEWVVITFDDFEGGFGNYTDGGGDCYLYTYGTYAHQGSNAADIQDNSGTGSSFYHTVGYDVSGYSELEVEFWFVAVSMDNSSEDFWVQYYDGSTWRTVAAYARSIDFENNIFYNKVVTISSSQYSFPTNARLRFMCDASGNYDDVYIDEIEFRGMSGGGSARQVAILDTRPVIDLPETFLVSDSRPNPFASRTEFTISLPGPAEVRTEIFNLQGQKITTLTSGYRDAGTHTISWDGTNQAGNPAASGIYYYRVVAGDNVVTKKMILTR